MLLNEIVIAVFFSFQFMKISSIFSCVSYHSCQRADQFRREPENTVLFEIMRPL